VFFYLVTSALNKELFLSDKLYRVYPQKRIIIKPRILQLFTEFGNNRRGDIKVRTASGERMRGFRKMANPVRPGARTVGRDHFAR
jgi:hypothetical protein